MIDEIRKKIAAGYFEFSKHAVDQSIIRHITVSEIQQALDTGELIEDYPNDKYGPTCLVLGYTKSNRPLHIQCRHPTRALIKIVTVYEPDPGLWVNFRVRKS